MTDNPNLKFYLSRGNPNNQPCGMGIDQQIFGKSIGGKIFTKESFLNGQTINYEIVSNDYILFDSIVTSDIIKNQVNYRAIFISNVGSTPILLNNIVIAMTPSDIYFNDVDIAVEGMYTFGEVSRDIPTQTNYAANPSIYLDDEYDSTNKLNGLTFLKVLDVTKIPTELSPNTCLKIWIRRKNIMDKTQLPDGSFFEGFTLVVNEYDNVYNTSRTFNYEKKDGRIPLSNWYDYSITSGMGTKVVLRELFPKEIDLTNFNIIKTFTTKNTILIYYSTTLENTTNYFLLTIDPNDNIKVNKYIQINLQKVNTNNENYLNLKLVDVYKSFYNADTYYLIWSEKIKSETQNSLGEYPIFDRVSVDIIKTNMWTSQSSFELLISGYNYRKITNYDLTSPKIIRQNIDFVNMEQFDDLFIMFVQDTTNYQLNTLENINLNTNQILYIFEKDILDEKNNKFNSYPGVNSQVLSHRLFPSTLQSDQRISSYNYVKNLQNSLIIADSENVNLDVSSYRTIKYLVDGTRYIDFNSASTKEFKINNTFLTYELPQNTNINNFLFTTNISINNDTVIYDNLNDVYQNNKIINNFIDGLYYDKPWFQKNIIDENNINSLSIPKEWLDRNYKDQFVDILSSIDNSTFTLLYNFKYNLWKIKCINNGVYNEYVFDIKSSKSSILTYTSGTTGTTGVSTTGSTGTTGTTGTSGTYTQFGKLHTDIDLFDIPYILEPGTYQPISLKIYVNMQAPGNYLVNYKVYFKSNEIPIFDIQSRLNSITQLNYILINPLKTLNLKINYLDLINSNNFGIKYYIKNLHKSLLNTINPILSSEKIVNKQLYPNQSIFKYYREIQLNGVENFSDEQNKSMIIPLIFYGNGYKNEIYEKYYTSLSIPEYETLTQNEYEVLKLNKNYKYLIDNPFDFSKIDINDKNIRLYFDSNLQKPINFKIQEYSYQNDKLILWVKIDDYTGSNKKLLLFYGSMPNALNKIDYVTLNNNLYKSDKYFGVWHFSKIFYNSKLSLNSGKILNAGEPILYEKSSTKFRLSKIDKEYMYGIAKIYKSYKFDLEIETPAEESLFFNDNVKTEFINFIKQTATLLKPSYTEINNVKQYGFNVLEAGELVGGNMGQTLNQKVTGLVSLTPNSNVNTYYNRLNDGRFTMLTSFNGFNNSIDWVVAAPTDTKLFKSGTLKVNGKLKSETIKFTTPFKDADYFVFLSSPSNQKLYWQTLCNNRFTITSSYYLMQEISWMAFHKDIFGGVYTPNSIYTGRRTINGFVETVNGESPTTANLGYWFNNEYLIQPQIGVDGDPGSMSIDPTNPGYSLLLSSNQNINIYWTNKNINQFSVKTSSPTDCILHWLVIKNGVEWWQELT